MGFDVYFAQTMGVVERINYNVVTNEVINIELHGASTSNWSVEGYDVEYWLNLVLIC